MSVSNPDFTLAEIGAAHNVTRERVRQIIKCYGDSGVRGGASARLTRLENERLKAYIKANGLQVPQFTGE
jgi:hypothetical protein